MFFQIALAANLVSADRASNRADIAYLFYLPFCHIFVSSDKLHRRCAPAILSGDQDFVWGLDLKVALTNINQSMSTASEEEREQGLHKLAPRPPGESTNLVVSMWERHSPGDGASKALDMPLDPAAEKKLVEHLKEFSEAPTAPDVSSIPVDDLESVAIERLVPPRRGSWWIIPKAVADKELDRSEE